MLRNLGTRVTSKVIVHELVLVGMEGRVDFVHAWSNFETKQCTGDAFLNFFDPADALVLMVLWHGREHLGGIPCRRRHLSVVFARKQGFDNCVLASRRKHMRDPLRMGWVHSSKLARVRELEQQLEQNPAPLGPPGWWPPPGLEAPLESVPS